MNVKSILGTLIILMFMACGPNEHEKKQAAEELARIQQAHDDSIRIVTEERIQARHNLELQIITLRSDLQTLKSQLSAGNIEMEVAIDRLSRIKEWQFGRSSSEREQQIREQSTFIQNLQYSINECRTTINNKELELSETTNTLESL